MNKLQKVCAALVLVSAAVQVTECIQAVIKTKKVFDKKRGDVIILDKSQYRFVD